jgi:hypothetical protein
MSDNIERALGRIEGKLDAALSSIDDRQEAQDKRLDNHGARIGGLEVWKARVLGIAAAAGVVGSLVVKVLL